MGISDLVLIDWLLPILLFILSLPLLLKIIPPNRFYGYRSGKSKANEKIWYKTNRLWGMLGVIASIIAFVWRYGAKLFLKSLSEDTSKTVTVIIFVSSVIIISIITIIFEQKLVKSLNESKKNSF